MIISKSFALFLVLYCVYGSIRNQFDGIKDRLTTEAICVEPGQEESLFFQTFSSCCTEKVDAATYLGSYSPDLTGLFPVIDQSFRMTDSAALSIWMARIIAAINQADAKDEDKEYARDVEVYGVVLGSISHFIEQSGDLLVEEVGKVQFKEPVVFHRLELFRIEARRAMFSEKAANDPQVMANEAVYYLAANSPDEFESIFGNTLQECVLNPHCVQNQLVHIYYLQSGKRVLTTSSMADEIVSRQDVRFKIWSDALKSYLPDFYLADTKFDWVYFGSPKKKVLPAAGKPFLIDHINSAATPAGYSARKALFIKRSEEVDKVALHELIHLYVRSIRDIHEDNFTGTLGRKSFNETFAEIFGMLGNCAFKAAEQPTRQLEAFHSAITDEYKFGLLQTAKILIHSGYTNFEDYLSAVHRANSIATSTNVVEYHIYKTAVIPQLERMLASSKRHSDSPKYLGEIVEKALMTVAFIKDMNNAMDFVRAEKANQDLSGLMSTLRMTITE